MTIWEAIWIAVIEGLTEFLPISSTAHMIFLSSFFGIEEDEYVKMFQVSIQFGAILSVVVLYWRTFFDFRNTKFYFKLAIAVIPALVLGYIFSDAIDAVMEKPLPIAIVLVVGGIVLLFVDRIFRNPKIFNTKELSFIQSFKIGLWQCLAMMPGTSRSAASIIGGMQQKLSRKFAAEFSFFLAVPTMLAATLYSVLLKHWDYKGQEMKGYEMITYNHQNLIMFILGNVVAFIVALMAIKFFVGYVQRNSFRSFGWYRIILGAILIIWYIYEGQGF